MKILDFILFFNNLQPRGLDSFCLDLHGSEQGTTTFLLHQNSLIPIAYPIKWIMTLDSAAFEKACSFPSGKSGNLGPR